MATRSIANRGKFAEKKVKEFLEGMSQKYAGFDYERLPDARAAGGRFKSMVGDFAYFSPGLHGVIEVKELKHPYRLPKDKLAQIQRMKVRELAGGRCFVVVYHTEEKLWRVILVRELPIITSGSWDLRTWPTYATLQEALQENFLR